MFFFTAFGDICIGVAAYAAGAYTWPWLHAKIVGAEAYAVSLRNRAIDLENRFRGK